jgi:hypothetical protein
MEYITVMYVVDNKCTVLFYIIFWTKQEYVKEYIM